MTSERSKRRDFLSLVFILKSISKKLLIEKLNDPLLFGGNMMAERLAGAGHEI